MQQLSITRQPLELPVFSSGQHLSANYWQATHTPVLDEGVEISYIIQHTVNITQQVLAKQGLKLNKQRKKKPLPKPNG